MIKNYNLENENEIPLILTKISNITSCKSTASKADNTFVCGFNSPGVTGWFKNLFISPGLSVSLLDINTKKPLNLCLNMTVPHMVELGFTLEGQVEYIINSQNCNFDNYGGQGHLSLCRGDMDCKVFMAPEQHLLMTEISFDKEIFFAYCQSMGFQLPDCFPSKRDREKQFITKCSTITPTFLTPLLHSLTCEISGSDDGSLKLEEDCIDLTKAMIQYLNGNMGNCKTILSSRDIDRVREARFLMEQNLCNPPRLLELSRLVNLNDYKLKRGFRQAYGTSVHKALTEMRLNRAREILMNPDIRISDAALEVGFRNIGDFGQAFKRHFGVLPSCLPERENKVF